jgi:hypothetical protein
MYCLIAEAGSAEMPLQEADQHAMLQVKTPEPSQYNRHQLAQPAAYICNIDGSPCSAHDRDGLSMAQYHMGQRPERLDMFM